MHRLIAATCACVLLTGCTVAPDAGTTPSATPTDTPVPAPVIPAVAAPSPTPAQSSAATLGLETPTPSPTRAPLDGTVLTCEPVTSQMVEWLRENQGTPDLQADQMVMVEVGEGNQAGSRWWVVASAFTTGRGTRTTPSWLTDAPSATRETVPQWIPLFHGGWNNVEWSGDILDRGKAAQTLALTCLPA